MTVTSEELSITAGCVICTDDWARFSSFGDYVEVKIREEGQFTCVVLSKIDAKRVVEALTPWVNSSEEPKT